MKDSLELREDIQFSDLAGIMKGTTELVFDDEAKEKVMRAKTFLDEQIASGEIIYGVNTGFGSFCEVRIDGEDLRQLQKNLILSHACGLGPKLPVEIARIMLASKASALCRGYSGNSQELIESLIFLFNNDLIPVIPEQGSLGASGDLAPLAHMSLPLIGEGLLESDGQVSKTKDSLDSVGFKLKDLDAKEGLALLNGTQYMSASLAWSLVHARKLLALADLIGAMSVLAWNGRLDAFDPHTHWLRRHEGQRKSADRIHQLLEHAGLDKLDLKLTQDPYSFRCMPQVHGASYDNIKYVASVVLDEINSVTDNPIIFAEDERVISGGNFHGQYLALAADQMKLALAELCSISERRIFNLLSGKRGLPAYLTEPDKAGLNSGLMIPQYTAASLVSQNKQLCSPASIDSISSSNGQEDHVSMGANACIALRKVLENTYKVLAIELLNACQGMDFRFRMTEDTSSLNKHSILLKIHHDFRSKSSHIKEDRLLQNDIETAISYLKGEEIDEIILPLLS